MGGDKMKMIGVLTRTFGDVILANTLARNIKLKYDGELDWVVDYKYADVLRHNPDIKALVMVKDTGAEWDYILETIVDGYDRVFMFQQLRPEDGTWHQQDKYRNQNLVEFYAKRGRIELVDKKLLWYFDEAVKGPQLEEGKKIFCHTTTLGDAKNWSKFNELVSKLKDEGYMVYQVGLPTDISMQLEDKFDWRGKVGVQELARMIKDNCNCFVGLDSGLSFMAAATGVPVICIMGASWSTTSGPWGENVWHLEGVKQDACAVKPCHGLFGTCRRGKEQKCIDKVSVEDVIKKIKEVAIVR